MRLYGVQQRTKPVTRIPVTLMDFILARPMTPWLLVKRLDGLILTEERLKDFWETENDIKIHLRPCFLKLPKNLLFTYNLTQPIGPMV